MTETFIEWNIVDAELNGKLESEANQLTCRIWPGGKQEGSGSIVALCIASRCCHWRWLHRGGMTYEKQTFQSEYPVPNGNANTPPADVPEGWTFLSWDHNARKDTPSPRFWASRL